jgi:hypothetical protein
MLNIRQLLVLICTIGTTSLYGMNLVRPYQILLRPPKQSNTFVQMYGISYFGFGSRAFGIEGEHVDALQLYECYQNALTMLDGFSTCSTIGQLSARIDAESDCNRGRFAPCGTFAVDGAANFGLRFFFDHDISLACYMPYYKMRLHDVFWRDLTGNTTIQDARTHAYLTDCICQKTLELGDLNIGDWSRSGVGDTTVSLEWISDFPQHREVLRNVTLNSRLGMTVPTALKSDEDKILAFSYGNDGAIGVVFAFGIDLFLGGCVKAGLDVQLMHTFGNNRCRRIKTSVLQTELFLLQKTSAFRDFGLTQQFSLYWQLYNIAGASFEVAYQYYKRGRDELSLTSNEFSSLIANSSLQLIGYTTHDIFLIASYDFERYMCADAAWSPYAAVFVDIPFNGKRAVVSRTAGFTLGINF